MSEQLLTGGSAGTIHCVVYDAVVITLGSQSNRRFEPTIAYGGDRICVLMIVTL